MAEYVLKPVTKTIKESFYLEDKEGNLVYEGNMTKFSLLGAAPHDFINHITNTTVQHTIGKPVMIEQGSGGIVSALSTRSYFKYDGKKIWDYLHDEGYRIDTRMSQGKLGFTYDVTYKGQPLATIATSSPKGKSVITMNRFLDVSCEEKDLDLVFPVAFAIAKTEQAFHN